MKSELFGEEMVTSEDHVSVSFLIINYDGVLSILESSSAQRDRETSKDK